MQTVAEHPGGRPLISVVMANYRAADKILPALRSVLGQTVADLEVIVSDDCSGDVSLDHVRRMMADDNRIRLLTADSNDGPATCRNRALDTVRGQWVAIVDSDDIIHPERFDRLLAAARHLDSDIIADDLLLFFEDGSPPRLLLDDDQDRPFAVTPERWLLAGVDGAAPLGYLKPLIRADLLTAIRYDEALRIGEDHDLVLRLLLAGARMTVVPEPFYLYRRHSGSISHRLSAADMRAMIGQQVELTLNRPDLPAELHRALAERLGQLRRGLAYEELVASIKGRNMTAALTALARDPSHLGRLWRSFAEGRLCRPGPPTAARAQSPLYLGAGPGHRPVPDYVRVEQIDWATPSRRQTWRDLAVFAGSAVHCADRAGHYAAGFIPEARIVPADAPEPVV